MSLKKNDIIECEITDTLFDGNGFCRYEDIAVFTPGCAKGDRVKIKILSIKKNIAYGKLVELLTPSPYRIENSCPVFHHCGGCVFRHISYKEELKIKYNKVKDCIQKIGKLNLIPEEILGCEHTDLYRNKAQFPVGMDNGKLKIGFYAPRSHRIIHQPSCALQPEVFKKVLSVFEEWILNNKIPVYDEITGKGLIRHLYLRSAFATGEIMACAVINGEDIPKKELLVNKLREAVPEVVSIVLNINKNNTNVILGDKNNTIWGKDTITEKIGGLRFEISPLSFFQVNSFQVEKLYGTAKEFAELKGDELLLDLYCGTGTIGLFMAGSVKKVIGVEVVADAVENARRNAENNGIQNAEFICSDAGEAAQKLQKSGTRPDVIILDPPRKGCDQKTIDSVVLMSPERIVYVSCDPATLARDLHLFEEQGYRTIRIKPVDMFPRTGHVETVVLMSRVEK